MAYDTTEQPRSKREVGMLGLLELSDRLAAVSPAAFDLCRWGDAHDELPDCKTPACSLGWAAAHRINGLGWRAVGEYERAVYGEDYVITHPTALSRYPGKEEPGPIDAAMAAFELIELEALELFGGSAGFYLPDRGFRTFAAVSPQLASERISAFATDQLARLGIDATVRSR